MFDFWYFVFPRCVFVSVFVIVSLSLSLFAKVPHLAHELLLLEAEQGHDARVAGAGQLAHHRLKVHHPRAASLHSTWVPGPGLRDLGLGVELVGAALLEVLQLNLDYHI